MLPFDAPLRAGSTGLFSGRGLALAAFALIVVVGTGLRAGDDDDEVPFDDAELFFELNDTDGDLGIHAVIDGEPWDLLTIEDPRERTILKTRARGRLGRQGLTEFRFESAEPTFDELDPRAFFRRFPEGEYEIEGRALDGFELESRAWISHVIPAAPDGVSVAGVALPEECEGDIPVIEGPYVVSWDPVETSHPDLGTAGEIEVEEYTLVVENDEATLEILLPADVTALEIPEGFIALGDEWKVEILVRASNLNRTATESCFLVN